MKKIKDVYSYVEYLKEKEALVFAAFCVYRKRGVKIEELQAFVDDYCSDFARRCIDENSLALKNECLLDNLIHHLSSAGAGHDRARRLLNAVYKELLQLKSSAVENSENVEKED